jgi:hypothetical protein
MRPFGDERRCPKRRMKPMQSGLILDWLDFAGASKIAACYRVNALAVTL